MRPPAALGPAHGYGIARRIEQIGRDVLQLNQETLYPALPRMGQEGWISFELPLAPQMDRPAEHCGVLKSHSGEESRVLTLRIIVQE